MTTNSPKFVLTGLVAASACFVLATTSSAQVNGLSAFPMSIDGRFTNGVGVGEWSDVIPSNFISQPGTTAIPFGFGNPPAPGANSALYAALGTTEGGPLGGEPTLHLLYDFLPRTDPFVLPGELVASVSFSVTLPGDPTGDKTLISVLFQGRQNAAGGAGVIIDSFFDIFVDLDFDGQADGTPESLGLSLDGAAGFGPSPLSSIDHLIVELGVSLRIPQEFGTPGGPFPGGGINPTTGLYDPDPVFWGAAGSGNGTGPLEAGGAGGPLQSASTAVFTILPDGSTIVTPVLVPEPTSAALLLAGVGAFAVRRRQRTA